MKATRQWHCQCGCGGTIEPGDDFTIEGGEFFLLFHSTGGLFEGADVPKRGIVREDRFVQQKGLSDLPLFDTEPVIQTNFF